MYASTVAGVFIRIPLRPTRSGSYVPIPSIGTSAKQEALPYVPPMKEISPYDRSTGAPPAAGGCSPCPSRIRTMTSTKMCGPQAGPLRATFTSRLGLLSPGGSLRFQTILSTRGVVHDPDGVGGDRWGQLPGVGGGHVGDRNKRLPTRGADGHEIPPQVGVRYRRRPSTTTVSGAARSRSTGMSGGISSPRSVHPRAVTKTISASNGLMDSM